MISAVRTDPAWIFWDSIAAKFNPGLLLALIVATWLVSRKKPNTGAFFFLFLSRAVMAILLVYVVVHIPRWLHVSANYPKFPSGHTAFAASVVTSLWLLETRSKYFTLPLLGLYAALIVALGHHSWPDIFGAFIVAPPLTLWCHRCRLVAREKVAL